MHWTFSSCRRYPGGGAPGDVAFGQTKAASLVSWMERLVDGDMWWLSRGLGHGLEGTPQAAPEVTEPVAPGGDFGSGGGGIVLKVEGGY